MKEQEFQGDLWDRIVKTWVMVESWKEIGSWATGISGAVQTPGAGGSGWVVWSDILNFRKKALV